MTPKACSLYDEIKVFRIRRKQMPKLSFVGEESRKYFDELIKNGFVGVVGVPKGKSLKQMGRMPYATIKFFK